MRKNVFGLGVLCFVAAAPAWGQSGFPDIQEALAAARQIPAPPAPTAAAQTASYADVLLRYYGAGYPALLAQRREYAAAAGLTLWADYARVDALIPFVRKAKPFPGSRTEASYDPVTDSIALFGGGEIYLSHELGHSLQHDAALAHAGTSLAKQVGLGDSVDSRVAYLLNQGELEVRLQELNRIFFTVERRPIMTPGDALKAFYYIGLDLPRWEIKELKARGIDTSDYRARKLRSVGTDAESLLTLFELVDRPDSDESRAAVLNILTWMLKNAPAHL